MNFKIAKYKYLIQPGYLLISKEATSVYGVTGSGVFVSLWDSLKSYSGCCSYLSPRPKDKKEISTKYGSIALKHLIKIMKKNGSKVENLKALIIGGGDIDSSMGHGTENLKVAETILNYFTIEILSKDTGGSLGRKFIYDTENGQSLTFKTSKIRKSDWFPYESRDNEKS